MSNLPTLPAGFEFEVIKSPLHSSTDYVRVLLNLNGIAVDFVDIDLSWAIHEWMYVNAIIGRAHRLAAEYFARIDRNTWLEKNFA